MTKNRMVIRKKSTKRGSVAQILKDEKKKRCLMWVQGVLKLGIIQARGRVEFGQEGDEEVCRVSGSSSSRGGEVYVIKAITRRIRFFHWISREAYNRTEVQRGMGALVWRGGNEQVIKSESILFKWEMAR